MIAISPESDVAKNHGSGYRSRRAWIARFPVVKDHDMPPLKPRRGFRPSLERLETLQLLSAGGATASVVNLKGTKIGRDAYLAIAGSTATFQRDNIYIHSLNYKGATDTVRGGAVVTYKIPVLGSVTSTIRFKTSLTRPRTRDVSVSVDKYSEFVSNKDRLKVATAIVNLITHDRQAIQDASTNAKTST